MSWTRVVFGVLVCAITLTAVSCSQSHDTLPATAAPTWMNERLGGATTAREFRGRPFNQVARSLTQAESKRFFQGAVSFDEFLTPESGLGPRFVDRGCISCHIDGDPASLPTDEIGPGALVRLSVPGVSPTGGTVDEPTYGGQLQSQAIPGATPEAHLKYELDESTYTYPDCSTVGLRAPRPVMTDWAFGVPRQDLQTSIRISPQLVGLGLLEAVPQDAIDRVADPQDANGDGISGRKNMVWNSATSTTQMGRFGWKAGQPTVELQTLAAMHQDIGLVTPGTEGQGFGDSVELTQKDLDDQVFYNRTIAVPVARNFDDAQVIRGAIEFESAGCASCHITTWTTGTDPIVGLSNQTIHPFTDLLLHDMGDGLADHRSEFLATGTEWRTPPLWGVGRRSEVTGFSTYLHDGRARSLEEAVLWHGGEAAAARDRFASLSSSEREDLLAFLGSL